MLAHTNVRPQPELEVRALIDRQSHGRTHAYMGLTSTCVSPAPLRGEADAADPRFRLAFTVTTSPALAGKQGAGEGVWDRPGSGSRQRVGMAHRARGGLLRPRPQLLRVAAAAVLAWCVTLLPQMQGVGANRIQDLAAYQRGCQHKTQDCENSRESQLPCCVMYVIRGRASPCRCACRASLGARVVMWTRAWPHVRWSGGRAFSLACGAGWVHAWEPPCANTNDARELRTDPIG